MIYTTTFATTIFLTVSTTYPHADAELPVHSEPKLEKIITFSPITFLTISFHIPLARASEKDIKTLIFLSL